MFEKKNERLSFNYHTNKKEQELLFISSTHSFIMKVISLPASFIVLLILSTSHLIFVNSVDNSKIKHFKPLTIKTMLDTFTYSSKSSYNACKNQYRSNNSIGQTNRCRFKKTSMFKALPMRYRLLVARKFNRKLLRSMKTPRCGVRNGPLFYSAGNRW
jgi:hypothetical protein